MGYEFVCFYNRLTWMTTSVAADQFSTLNSPLLEYTLPCSCTLFLESHHSLWSWLSCVILWVVKDFYGAITELWNSFSVMGWVTHLQLCPIHEQLVPSWWGCLWMTRWIIFKKPMKETKCQRNTMCMLDLDILKK